MATKREVETKDPELFAILRAEKKRQRECIELIASENFTSREVLECLGSAMTNKYSEGTVGRRYYGGTEHIDELESLCISRALSAFGLNPENWGVNVQPYSGSPANFEVFTALLQPHDRLMGLDLPSGGHLTHGFYTGSKKVSASSIYFESLPYRVDPSSGLIDFDQLSRDALLFRPKLIIAGMSAYSRNLDYSRFREIADKCGAYLLADMAHVAGLVAAGLAPSPFEFCDIVTSTTHKTLRGPRSGIIFFNKKRINNIEAKINDAVFPTLQGGPHNHQIAALACQLKEVMSIEWRDYCASILSNCKILCESLNKLRYKIVTGGSDNHLFLWDLRPTGISGSKFQAICDAVNITLNKNTVPGDESAFTPMGVRIGTPAMTSRKCTTQDFKYIAQLLHKTLLLAQEIVKKGFGPKLVDFQKGLQETPEVQDLKNECTKFASSFFLPGHDDI